MNTIARMMMLVGMLILSACDAVYTQQPMGDETVVLDEATWQGTWLGDEVVVLTTVIDGERGLLQAAWVERGPDGARFETVTGTVRQTGSTMYLNMEHLPAEDGSVATSGQEDTQTARSPEYYWALIRNSGQKVVLWSPNVGQFRIAVGEKRLPGTIRDEDDVVLGPLNKTQLEQINSPRENLLQWSEPLVLIRIGD